MRVGGEVVSIEGIGSANNGREISLAGRGGTICSEVIGSLRVNEKVSWHEGVDEV